MSFIDQMSNLRADLNDTEKRTKAAVKQTKKDTHELCRQAQGLVREFTARQKANACLLHEELKSATSELKSRVKKMRGNNISQQGAMRREFAQARDVFWGKKGLVPREKKEEKKKEKKEP